MKKLLLVSAVAAVLSTSAMAADVVKIGMLQGFTGPTESLVAPMAMGGELAIKEVSDSGIFLGGKTVESVRGDSTCIDAAAATAAAERLVTSDGVSAINGATCSGATTAVLNNVAIPNGVVMISPSATSPALSTLEDNGLFFRTAPSDARQGQVMADVLGSRGIKTVALTHTNNDYGKGLADSFKVAFEAAGGTVTITAAHEDGKADYAAEIGALSSAGGDVLVVAGYLDQGGKGVIQASLDSGAFETFMLPDGMVGDSLTGHFGADINASFGTVPGTDSPGAAMMAEITKNAGFNGTDPYVPECYDASALILLAMQSAGSSDSAKFKDHVMNVANAPGEKIYPGELAKGLKILADGGEIDYVGGSAVELIGSGESSGSYREVEVQGGKFETVTYH
ncbi:MAG: branched-chain amino acid transport system substrate-binding protein [Gammaproteobacteria bacterium]|jgi:branched-chain amino acid transport system substrate-binding protein